MPSTRPSALKVTGPRGGRPPGTVVVTRTVSVVSDPVARAGRVAKERAVAGSMAKAPSMGDSEGAAQAVRGPREVARRRGEDGRQLAGGPGQ
ncbi:hypothetical protein R6L23_01635 [Streptomyces sp. SR27]|uniref:hypothetical protein n=1 Tax=Streptomyces sp. SR27 TaxID=3076630 RepID=UPI00295B210D|nr:hypothetical protein [Streptomyces sp. SR27]MDV9186937.1 hypothetical protein [Streptomyces sp. SR27]